MIPTAPRTTDRGPTYDTIDWSNAAGESGNTLAGMDLPPALNVLHCRRCGKPTRGIECEDEKCREGKP